MYTTDIGKKYKKHKGNKSIQLDESKQCEISDNANISYNSERSFESTIMEIDNFDEFNNKDSNANKNFNESNIVFLANSPHGNDSESIISFDEHMSDNIRQEVSAQPEILMDFHDYRENSKKRKAASNKCINYECTNGENLREAPIFCLSFYRVQRKFSKIQKVCEECYESCFAYYEERVAALKQGQNLIDQDIPLRDSYVEISDSEEETNSEYREESVVYFKETTKKCIANVVNDVMNQYRFEGQVHNSIKNIQQRFAALAETFAELDNKQTNLQKKLNSLFSNLYNSSKPETRELLSIEIIDSHEPPSTMPVLPRPIPETQICSKRKENKYSSVCELITTDKFVPAQKLSRPILPPAGELERLEPVVGEIYYAMRICALSVWSKCQLLEIIQKKNKLLYKVHFKDKINSLLPVCTVSGKELAYTTKCNVRLEVGTRVIALFHDDNSIRQDAYFSGVIAEPLSLNNKYRYLIFFDNGYAQYVPHSKVLLVVESSKNVWEDVHPNSQLFVRKYIENYPERPMVKLKVGQVVKTEWNSKWRSARVVEVDGSLVHMYFDVNGYREWIFRGSTRFNVLYLEMLAARNRQDRKPHVHKIHDIKKDAPYVEYRRFDEGLENSSNPVSLTTEENSSSASSEFVASNSGSEQSSAGRNMNLLTLADFGKPKTFSLLSQWLPLPREYISHECSVNCQGYVTLPLSALKAYNPLSKPLLCGWYRLVIKHKNKKEIRYRAPCARMIRNISELHKYLRMTESYLSIDMFVFDLWVDCLSEYVVENLYRTVEDISHGVENMPVPCGNFVDNIVPDFTNYSTKREPMEGVNLNLDKDFLCGCDCEDDCADKQKCQCWQLTIREARTLNKKISDDRIGYSYKRLRDSLPTGIYECNSRCKCGPSCLNRVVQHPLQLKLQIFKTENRGWGVRCLNDIPEGAYICTYAGSLLTDNMANEAGITYGDEYFMELDYIEVVESAKYGYESEVIITEHEDEQKDDDTNAEELAVKEVHQKHQHQNVDKFTYAVSASASELPSRIRLQQRKEDVTKPSSFEPRSETGINERCVSKFKSVRKMFGEEELSYIMDAKNTGNVARFFNHSCNPNVFVQNVFIETHDLRFPWVAFFAMKFIKAGTELTCNYNYDVGSVPNKVIYCQCGSTNCRGRLL